MRTPRRTEKEEKVGKIILTKESADYMRKVGEYIRMLDEKGEMKEELTEEMKKKEFEKIVKGK